MCDGVEVTDGLTELPVTLCLRGPFYNQHVEMNKEGIERAFGGEALRRQLDGMKKLFPNSRDLSICIDGRRIGGFVRC